MRAAKRYAGPSKKLARALLDSIKGGAAEGMHPGVAAGHTEGRVAPTANSLAEAKAQAAKGKTKADGTPWYMDGQHDVDGWADTNANDVKKAEAAGKA
jgi:hypothetical protein